MTDFHITEDFPKNQIELKKPHKSKCCGVF